MTTAEFKTLLVPLSKDLYYVAFRILGNADDAHDAVQDLYVKLWQMRGKMNKSMNLKAYTATMMRNSCYDRFRAKRLDVDDAEIENHYGLVSEENLSSDYENRDLVAILRKRIEKLPANQRKVIEMRDIDGLEYSDIERETGLEQGNIRVLLSRARKSLREQIFKIVNYGQK